MPDSSPDGWPAAYLPLLDEPDSVYAWRLVDAFWQTLDAGGPPPRVALGTGRDGQLGVYHPASRTIVLSCPRRLFVDTLAHELQHHLDELVGQSLGGQKRGAHDPAFYARLDRTRIELGLEPLLSQEAV